MALRARGPLRHAARPWPRTSSGGWPTSRSPPGASPGRCGPAAGWSATARFVGAVAIAAPVAIVSLSTIVAHERLTQQTARREQPRAGGGQPGRDSSRKRAEEREDMALKAIDNYRKVVEVEPGPLDPVRPQAAPAATAGRTTGLLSPVQGGPGSRNERAVAAHGARRQVDARPNFALAWLNAESGTPVDALKSYQEAVDILEPVVDRTNDRFHRRDLAMVYNNLGNLQVDIGRFDEARTTHEKALALRQGLARERPDDMATLCDLSYSEHNLGWLDSKVGRPESALAHYREPSRCGRRSSSDSEAGRPPGRAGGSLSNMGWVIASTGRKNEARDVYRRGVDELEKCVAEQPNVVCFRSNLAQTLCGLGEQLEGNDAGRLRQGPVARRGDRRRGANRPPLPIRSGHDPDACRKPRPQLQGLRRGRRFAAAGRRPWRGIRADDLPEMVPYQLALANSLSHLGLTLVDADRPAEGLALHERAKGVYEALLRKNPADIGVASMLAGALNNAAIALTKLGRHEEAVRVLHEAIARDARLPRARPQDGAIPAMVEQSLHEPGQVAPRPRAEGRGARRVAHAVRAARAVAPRAAGCGHPLQRRLRNGPVRAADRPGQARDGADSRRARRATSIRRPRRRGVPPRASPTASPTSPCSSGTRTSTRSATAPTSSACWLRQWTGTFRPIHSRRPGELFDKLRYPESDLARGSTLPGESECSWLPS